MKPISMMEASGSKIAMIFFASFMWQHFSKFGENFYSNELSWGVIGVIMMRIAKSSILTRSLVGHVSNFRFWRQRDYVNRFSEKFWTSIFINFITYQGFLRYLSAAVRSDSVGRLERQGASQAARQLGLLGRSWSWWATNWVNETLISKYAWYIMFRLTEIIWKNNWNSFMPIKL